MEEMFDKLKEHAYKAKDGAVKITKTVIEKTNNVVNQTKLNFAIGETQGKIKDIYTEIGKAIYDKYTGTGEIEEALAEKMGKIDALNEELMELKENLAELKETVKCPECNAYNHHDDAYCSKCGAKLYSEDAEVDEENDDIVTIQPRKPEDED